MEVRRKNTFQKVVIMTLGLVMVSFANPASAVEYALEIATLQSEIMENPYFNYYQIPTFEDSNLASLNFEAGPKKQAAERRTTLTPLAQIQDDLNQSVTASSSHTFGSLRRTQFTDTERSSLERYLSNWRKANRFIESST